MGLKQRIQGEDNAENTGGPHKWWDGSEYMVGRIQRWATAGARAGPPYIWSHHLSYTIYYIVYYIIGYIIGPIIGPSGGGGGSFPLLRYIVWFGQQMTSPKSTTQQIE